MGEKKTIVAQKEPSQKRGRDTDWVSDELKEKLKSLPDAPGVYLHRDKMGEIIYVGKAISLKNRVRQYFQSRQHMDPKVRAMVGHIADFEFILCQSEMEAFILENNLIKENRPKYNILLRDDKTYPYVRITPEAWPRLLKTRVVEQDKGRYFGPYADVTAVNDMLRVVNDIFQLKRCGAKDFPPGHRPCLNYHIGKCQGICTGKVNKAAYLEQMDTIAAFFAGRDGSIEAWLTKKMREASQDMAYEEAAKYRDYLLAAKSLKEGQRVVLHQDVDLDVVLAVDLDHMAVFFVREGKLSGREIFDLRAQEEDSVEERTGQFITQYYGGMTQGPSEILVADRPEDSALIEAYLTTLWGRKVTIRKPQKGEKKALLDLAISNRNQMVENLESRTEQHHRREERISLSISELLKCLGKTNPAGEEAKKAKGAGEEPQKEPGKPREKRPPKAYRIEAYDVSNTNGIDTVSAMVVFVGEKPDKRAYRKFKIRTQAHGDDYASMQETLYRRFKRLQEGDPGFSLPPDLIIIDGGKGHLHAAEQILGAMGLRIPVVGAVKDNKHRTRGLVYTNPLGDVEEMDLREKPLLFSYVGRIQEEVHRFAIEYHRKVREQGTFQSILDEIPGIGPRKRTALLMTLGSVEAVKEATKETLLTVPGIREKEAEAIQTFFRQREDGSQTCQNTIGIVK